MGDEGVLYVEWMYESSLDIIVIIELFGEARRCPYRWGVIMYHWRLFSGDPGPTTTIQTSEHQTVIKKFIFLLGLSPPFGQHKQ